MPVNNVDLECWLKHNIFTRKFCNFQNVSPISLDQKLSVETKLIMFIFLAVLGSALNIAHCMCIFKSKDIRDKGLFFMFFMGISDSVVSILIIPLTVFAIASKSFDTVKVCHFEYFLAVSSTYSYSLLSLANYCEYSQKVRFSTKFLGHTARITLCSFFIICISCALAAIGVYGMFDYDYCQQRHEADFTFRALTAVGFMIIPMMFTVIYLIKGFLRAREKIQAVKKNFPGRNKKTGKRHYFIIEDANVLPLVNLLSYLFFVIMWIPYVIRIHYYPDGDSQVYINLAVFALSRCVFAPCLYWSDNLFRGAYGKMIDKWVDAIFCRKDENNAYEARKRNRRAARNFQQEEIDQEAGEVNGNEIISTRSLDRL